MAIYWFKSRVELMSMVLKRIDPVPLVLDIGCGIQPQDYVVPAVHICCEPFGQYVEYLQKAVESKAERRFKDRHYVILQATWADTVERFPARSVDTVFLMDVIEHLEKGDSQKLITATEQLARRQVIVFTPLGFMKQEHPDGKDAWGLDGGKWQEHRSGWMPEDFDESWDIFATQDFHRTDNMGRVYDSPVGAFYAVKTISPKPVNTLRLIGKLTSRPVKPIDFLSTGCRAVRRVMHKLGKMILSE